LPSDRSRLVLSCHQKLAALRTEADNAIDRAEAAEAKNKKLEQELLHKDQEIASLTHKLSVSEAECEKAETKLAELKGASGDVESSRQTADGLNRKVQLLEEELDAAERNVKETVEKYVLPVAAVIVSLVTPNADHAYLSPQASPGRRESRALRTPGHSSRAGA
jgi:septal ring factor EnvC (AmiA/AmiB activator)